MGREQSDPRREPTFDSPAPRVEAGERAAGTAKPARRKRGGKRKKGRGKRRPLLARFAYWSAVAGLWLIIAAGGLVGWVGAHLPPIQSLEIPKRAPAGGGGGGGGRARAGRGGRAGPPGAREDRPP